MLARLWIIALLAACGRLDFDATTDLDCDAELVVAADSITSVQLCPHTRILVDMPAGARLSATLTVPTAQLRAVDLELDDPDSVRLAGPTWTSTGLDTTALVTTAGMQALEIDADEAVAATLTTVTVAPPGRVLAMSPSDPWTPQLQQLVPGDTLILEDGVYVPTVIDCTVDVRSGTQAAPITLVARHPRRAHLQGDGTGETLYVESCAWWIIDGLYSSNADAGSTASGEPLLLRNVSSVIARNLLLVHPNRCGNNHGVEVFGPNVKDVLIEDTEVYDFHRGALFVADGPNLVVRRSYAHSRDASAQPCYGADSVYPLRGDNGFECYAGTGNPTCVAENVLVENVAAAFDADDAASFAVASSLARDTYIGAIHTSLFMPPTPGAPHRIDNFVCLGCEVGVWTRGLDSTTANATLLDGPDLFEPTYGRGVYADGFGGTAGTTTWRNIISAGNANAGFDITGQASWLVAYSTAAGNLVDYPAGEPPDDALGSIQHSLTVAPTGVGNHDGECLAYVPASSNMHGAGEAGGDIGANVIYQVIDGVTTDRKLWNQRTGQFPCGAIVPGVNDIPGSSCFDAHTRFRVGVAGCAIP